MIRQPTQEVLRQLLRYDPETGKLFWKKRGLHHFKDQRSANVWNSRYSGREAGSHSPDGYISLSVQGAYIRAHRAIWAIVHGTWPVGEIDHINGKRSDNRLQNLRDVPKAINQRNQKLSAANTTGAAGVYRCNGKWSAQISANGVTAHLGVFGTYQDAVDARRKAESEFGFHENHGRQT